MKYYSPNPAVSKEQCNQVLKMMSCITPGQSLSNQQFNDQILPRQYQQIQKLVCSGNKIVSHSFREHHSPAGTKKTICSVLFANPQCTQLVGIEFSDT